METAVWIVLGIVALNVGLVAGLFGLQLVRRQQADWVRRGLQERLRVPSLPTSHASNASTVRRVTGLGLVGALSVVLVILSGIDAGRVLTSALEVVVPVLGPAAEQPERASAGRSGARGAGAVSPRDAESSGAVDVTGSPVTSGGALPGNPAVPTEVDAVPTSATAIRVIWAAVPMATGYAIDRSDDGLTGWSEIGTTPVDVTAFVDGGLSADTTYFYRVVAITESGEAPPSDVIFATTSPSPPSSTVVTVLATTSSTVDLSWIDVADENGYRIERSLDGVDWATVATIGPDVTTHADAGLAPETTYLYRVVATSAEGDAAPSEIVTATTAGAGGSPGGVDAGGGSQGSDEGGGAQDAGATPPPDPPAV